MEETMKRGLGEGEIGGDWERGFGLLETIV